MVTRNGDNFVVTVIDMHGLRCLKVLNSFQGKALCLFVFFTVFCFLWRVFFLFFKPHNKSICNWIIFLWTSWHPACNLILKFSMLYLKENAAKGRQCFILFLPTFSALYTHPQRERGAFIFFPPVSTYIEDFLFSVSTSKDRLLISYTVLCQIRGMLNWTELSALSWI